MTRSLDQEPIKTTQPQPENPWVEAAKTIITAGVLAVGIRTLVAEARYIPSSSMEPTLQINDRLIIEKISYHLHDPKRGDVVVFNPTKALQEQNFKDAFIKRIIGLPGDTIKISNGIVYVNGGKLSEDYISQKPDNKTPCYRDGKRAGFNCELGHVPDGQYLVFGDNRANSYDSRYWGFVPKDKLIGRAFVRFWPLNRLGMLNQQSGEQPAPAKNPSTNTVKSLK
jgi:signal peptidase I